MLARQLGREDKPAACSSPRQLCPPEQSYFSSQRLFLHLLNGPGTPAERAGMKERDHQCWKPSTEEVSQCVGSSLCMAIGWHTPYPSEQVWLGSPICTSRVPRSVRFSTDQLCCPGCLSLAQGRGWGTVRDLMCPRKVCVELRLEEGWGLAGAGWAVGTQHDHTDSSNSVRLSQRLFPKRHLPVSCGTLASWV